MNIEKSKEIAKIFERLKEGMIDYIEPGETGYTELDVEKCMTLLNNFLVEISDSDSKEKGMLSVKKVVVGLNNLNEKCEHC